MTERLIGAAGVCFGVIAGSIVVISRWFWPLFTDQAHNAAIATATSIILGITTLCFVVFASLAAIMSAEASTAQARAAEAQADSARLQTDVAEVQLKLSKAALKEQTRPFLQLRRCDPSMPWSYWGQRYEIDNIGSGAAVRLQIVRLRADRSDLWGTDRTMIDFTIAPKQTSNLLVRGGGYTYIRIFYESVVGDHYISTFGFTLHDELATVYVENHAGAQPISGSNVDPRAVTEWQKEQRDSGLQALQ